MRTRIVSDTFHIFDWNCSEENRSSIVYRPGGRTLARRSMYSLLLLLCAGGLAWSAWTASNRATDRSGEPELESSTQAQLETIERDLRSTMSEDEWAQFEARLAAQQDERAAQRYETEYAMWRADRILQIAFWSLVGALVLPAVLIPLSTAWHQVTIVASGNQRLSIHSRGVWSKQRDISLHEYPRIAICAREIVHRRRRSGLTRNGYRWILTLEPAREDMMAAQQAKTIELHVDHQRDRPIPEMPLPPRVRQLANALQRMTGIEPEPMYITDYAGARRTFMGGKNVVVGRNPFFSVKTLVGEPIVTSRSIPLDELTPEMREQVHAMMHRAGGGVVTTELISDGGTITFRDADGVTHRYRSIDEMPPDVRAMFEQLRSLGGSS